MELEHKQVVNCTRVQIKATRKGTIISIKVFHMYSWVGISYRGKQCGGKGCSHNCVSVCTSKVVGLANMYTIVC